MLQAVVMVNQFRQLPAKSQIECPFNVSESGSTHQAYDAHIVIDAELFDYDTTRPQAGAYHDRRPREAKGDYPNNGCPPIFECASRQRCR